MSKKRAKKVEQPRPDPLAHVLIEFPEELVRVNKQHSTFDLVWGEGEERAVYSIPGWACWTPILLIRWIWHLSDKPWFTGKHCRQLISVWHAARTRKGLRGTADEQPSQGQAWRAGGSQGPQ